MTPIRYIWGTRTTQQRMEPSITLAATRSPMSAPPAMRSTLPSIPTVYWNAFEPKTG